MHRHQVLADLDQHAHRCRSTTHVHARSPLGADGSGQDDTVVGIATRIQDPKGGRMCLLDIDVCLHDRACGPVSHQ